MFWIDANAATKSTNPTIDRKSVKVERFWVQGEKFSQLSGMATRLAWSCILAHR